MRVNQMRLWLASLAYVLIARLRKWGLQGTEWARAQARTLRSKLLKIGALVKVSVRRVFPTVVGTGFRDLEALSEEGPFRPGTLASASGHCHCNRGDRPDRGNRVDKTGTSAALRPPRLSGREKTSQRK